LIAASVQPRWEPLPSSETADYVRGGGKRLAGLFCSTSMALKRNWR
jgi:hypothetical protein